MVAVTPPPSVNPSSVVQAPQPPLCVCVCVCYCTNACHSIITALNLSNIDFREREREREMDDNSVLCCFFVGGSSYYAPIMVLLVNYRYQFLTMYGGCKNLQVSVRVHVHMRVQGKSLVYKL